MLQPQQTLQHAGSFANLQATSRKPSVNSGQQIQHAISMVSVRNVPVHLFENFVNNVPSSKRQSRPNIAPHLDQSTTIASSSMSIAVPTSDASQPHNFDHFINKVNITYDLDKIRPSQKGSVLALDDNDDVDEEDIPFPETHRRPSMLQNVIGAVFKGTQKASLSNDSLEAGAEGFKERVSHVASIWRANGARTSVKTLEQHGGQSRRSLTGSRSSTVNARVSGVLATGTILIVPEKENEEEERMDEDSVPEVPVPMPPSISMSSGKRESLTVPVLSLARQAASESDRRIKRGPNVQLAETTSTSTLPIRGSEQPSSPSFFDRKPSNPSLSDFPTQHSNPSLTETPAPVDSPTLSHGMSSSQPVERTESHFTSTVFAIHVADVDEDSKTQPLRRNSSTSNKSSRASLAVSGPLKLTISQATSGTEVAGPSHPNLNLTNSASQASSKCLYIAGQVATPISSRRPTLTAIDTSSVPLSPTNQHRRRSVSGFALPVLPRNQALGHSRRLSTGIVIPATPSSLHVAVAAAGGDAGGFLGPEGRQASVLYGRDGRQASVLSDAAIKYMDAFAILRASAPVQRRAAMRPEALMRDEVKTGGLDSFGKVVKMASDIKQAGLFDRPNLITTH
ncbi:hypothetical protein BC830DRAFT_1121176 [Chytriomyces sp. MP71]|nr:hypothetical protein BC830DRAFT_1121176 [Chytriomyces sp. MP71]